MTPPHPDSLICRYVADREVSPDLDRQLRALFLEAFPHEAAYLEKQRFFRECPPHRWILFTPEGQSVAHLAIYDKVLGTTAGDVRVIGVAEVCVTAAWRRLGLVHRMLAEAHAWARKEEIPFSLLFGSPAYYGGSGYRETGNVYRYWHYQDGKWIEEPIAGALALSFSGQSWPEGLIDLRGPMF